MISYVDQLVVDNLDSLLKGFLNNSYIIKEEILKELPSDIVDSFINEYSIDKGKGTNIPIGFTFPSNFTSGTYVLVQYKGSQEVPEDSSIGALQGGISSQAEGDVVKEKLQVTVDKDTKEAYITLTNPAYKLISVKETNRYEVKKGDTKVTIPYAPFYEDNNHFVHVAYEKYRYDSTNSPVEDKDIEYIGINTVEGVTVDVVSSNINNLRCLFGIMNGIFIYLKTALETNYNVTEPQIKVEGDDLLQDFNSSTDSVNGQRLFTRRFEITYKVTQTMPPLVGDKVNKVQLDSGTKEDNNG